MKFKSWDRAVIKDLKKALKNVDQDNEVVDEFATKYSFMFKRLEEIANDKRDRNATEVVSELIKIFSYGIDATKKRKVLVRQN